ncbi:hypothetical protein [Geothrix edaphica]|nr:hypothetical protein [Geothrix edaphica]
MLWRKLCLKDLVRDSDWFWADWLRKEIRASSAPFSGFQMSTRVKGQEIMCRESIRRTLALSAGIAPDSRGVAEATLRTWGQMAARLAPVIGARGVDALFGRSLQVTSATFPWLSKAGGSDDSANPLTNLRASLEAIDPVVGTEGSFALLVAFTELLAALIGESLTERLLDPVWTPPKPTTEQETHP